MDEEELLQVESRLRTLLEGSDLEWVLDEVDTAIAEGIPEERILRRRSQRGRSTREWDLLDYGQIPVGEIEASRKSGTLVITTRTMSVRERVQLLLDAVRRVVVELPTIEAETLGLLKAEPAGGEGERAAVEATAFEPEEGSRRRRDQRTVISERMSGDYRARISALFAAVRAEADDERIR